MNKKTTRKIHSIAFKKQVVLAALRQNKTMTELCQEFEICESQIYNWRLQAIESLESAFQKGKKCTKNDNEQKIAKLHQKIGELTVERDFLEDVWSRIQCKKGKQ